MYHLIVLAISTRTAYLKHIEGSGTDQTQTTGIYPYTLPKENFKQNIGEIKTLRLSPVN